MGIIALKLQGIANSRRKWVKSLTFRCFFSFSRLIFFEILSLILILLFFKDQQIDHARISQHRRSCSSRFLWERIEMMCVRCTCVNGGGWFGWIAIGGATDPSSQKIP